MLKGRTISLLAAWVFSALVYESKVESQSFNYPTVRRNESVVDDYFGTMVVDAYRWMEDMETPEMMEFIDAQNNFTNAYLAKATHRPELRERLTAIFNYPRKTAPIKVAENYFYFANTGLQNQNVMYKTTSLDVEGVEFLNPNLLSGNGTSALNPKSSFSEDGKTFAFGVFEDGVIDFQSVYFRDVETMNDLPDVLHMVAAAPIVWTHDNKGIFYSGIPAQLFQNVTMYYHRIGTPQSEDIVILEFPEPSWFAGMIYVTTDGKRLVLEVVGNDEGEAINLRETIPYVADIPDEIVGKLEFVKLVPKFDAYYVYIGSGNATLYFMCNEQNASNFKIVSFDAENLTNIQTVIPEDPKRAIFTASVVGKDEIVVTYLEDVKSKVEIWSRRTMQKVGSVDIDIGTVTGAIPGENNLVYLDFQSHLVPNRIYVFNLSDPAYESQIYWDTTMPGFNPEDYETKQVFYPSFDNVSIPMYIMHRKGLEVNSDTPVHLYGYGGFGLSLTPYFDTITALYTQSYNGIYAIANIRGGGEYGEAWHTVAMRETKQVTFNDFIAAAEYLIKNNYTNPSKLSIEGASDGGKLVAVVANQRPDLYKAVLSRVGLHDMLRYPYYGAGEVWVGEMGDPRVPEEFKYIYAYSSLHNIKIPNDTSVQYPAILVMTGDHDTRVSPFHSYKYGAELQHTLGSSSKQTNIIGIRIEADAGHGGGKPIEKMIEEMVDIFSFLELTVDIQFDSTRKL